MTQQNGVKEEQYFYQYTSNLIRFNKNKKTQINKYECGSS